MTFFSNIDKLLRKKEINLQLAKQAVLGQIELTKDIQYENAS